MLAPKFIRFRSDTINVTKIIDVSYRALTKQTAICYEVGGQGLWTHYDGDCRDELWELIKLAMQPRDEKSYLASYPSDVTHLEKRVEGIEAQIGENFAKKNRTPDNSVLTDVEKALFDCRNARKVIGYLSDGSPVFAA